MSKKVWTFTPHLGGKKISPETQDAVRKLITEHAEKNYHGKFTRLDIKFRGALCYIDAYQEPYVPEGDPPEWMNETREQYIERLKNTSWNQIESNKGNLTDDEDAYERNYQEWMERDWIPWLREHVNGDSFIPNARARAMEPVFKARMFAEVQA